jgi:flavin-dependent dehydrogenase
VGSWTHTGPRLRQSLDRVTRYYRLDPNGYWGLRGHRLPVRRPDAPLAGDRILVVGDAAGLLAPRTYEGMYAAVWSGQIAAAHLAAFLTGQLPDLRSYEAQVRRELVPELDLAGRLADLFALIPTAYMGLAQHSATYWRLIGRLARGADL